MIYVWVGPDCHYFKCLIVILINNHVEFSVIKKLIYNSIEVKETSQLKLKLLLIFYYY
jgi:hypothetical protein